MECGECGGKWGSAHLEAGLRQQQGSEGCSAFVWLPVLLPSAFLGSLEWFERGAAVIDGTWDKQLDSEYFNFSVLRSGEHLGYFLSDLKWGQFWISKIIARLTTVLNSTLPQETWCWMAIKNSVETNPDEITLCLCRYWVFIEENWTLVWKDMQLQCSFDCAACKSKINVLGKCGLWRCSWLVFP